MSEFAPKDPQEKPPFSSRDFQLLRSMTGSIDDACRAFPDPLRRADALFPVLRDAMAMSRDQAKISPVLSAVLAAEAFAAAPDFGNSRTLAAGFDSNINIAGRVKYHLRDALDEKFRLLNSGVPESDAAYRVLSIASAEAGLWQREAVEDPKADSATQYFAILAFMAGATAGQPQYGTVDELMRYANASITD